SPTVQCNTACETPRPFPVRLEHSVRGEAGIVVMAQEQVVVDVGMRGIDRQRRAVASRRMRYRGHVHVRIAEKIPYLRVTVFELDEFLVRRNRGKDIGLRIAETPQPPIRFRRSGGIEARDSPIPFLCFGTTLRMLEQRRE